MKANRFFNGWSLAVILLVIVIIAGGVIIYTKNQNSPGIEISLSEPKHAIGNIYIGEGVNNPGIYPVFTGDTLDDIIGAAGGLKDMGHLQIVKLSVFPVTGAAQKIDINRAEVWLLEALPGVGETKAQAIAAYREQNGLFRDTKELMNVPGFGDVNYEKIKDYITVNE